MRARTLSALWPLFIQRAGAIPQTHATQHVGTDSFEWFAPEVVNSFDPPALDAKPPVSQPPQKKFAFVVLVHFEPTPWLLSLLRHYRDALPPSWKLVVALSLARLETDGMRFGTKEKPAQDAIEHWQRALAETGEPPERVSFAAINSTHMQSAFPHLPIQETDPLMGGSGRFWPPEVAWAWSHHETSLLMVPGLSEFDFVWLCENDLVFYGNLRGWFEFAGSLVDDHAIDLYTGGISLAPSDWMHLQRCVGAPCTELRPVWTGYEHLRGFSRDMLQELERYYVHGEYMWGEAFAPSICQQSVACSSKLFPPLSTPSAVHA